MDGSISGRCGWAEFLSLCEEIHIPLIVMGEMQAGLLGGKHRKANEGLMRRFLDRPTVKLLFPSRQTAMEYARIFVQLKNAGRPIPDNDIWIAAMVVEHVLRLITRDKHFSYLPQLELE
jgi:predicted nucleic acid-binding protein